MAKAYRGRNYYLQTARKAFPYVLKGTRNALKAYNSFSRIRSATRKKSTSAVGVTRNHDYKVQYSKKSMPRWKKKRWVNFSKKVNAVLVSKLGTRTQIFNKQISLTNTTGNQAYTGLILYGKNGQNGSECAGMSDLRDIVNVGGYSNGEMLMFKSAILDITFATPIDATAAIEMDIYDVAFRGQTLQGNIRVDVQAAESATPTLGTAGSLSMTNRGAGLFDFPIFLSNTKCKIFKKTKVFLPPGNTSTYQIRDPKNRNVYVDDLTEYAAAGLGGWIQPGWSRGVFVVFKPTAGSQATTQTLNIGVTTKYAYVLNEDNRVFDGAN